MVALFLCLILIPLGMYVNLKDYEKRQRSYEQSVTIYQQDHPRESSVARGAKGFRKPSMFSIFSIGLEYYLPTTVHSDPLDGVSFSNDRGLDNPHSMLFGKIDLLFNVSIVISLLALLLTFNSVTGEKESGTLKLTLSNAVPRHSVLLSKFIGNYLVLFIPFLFSLLIGVLILIYSGKVPIFSSDYFPYFLLMLFSSMLIIAVFFNLGIFVSSLTSRSATAIVVLLLVWVFSALAFPRISTMIAEVVCPVKTDMVLALEKSAVLKSLDEEERAEYSDIWSRVGDSDRFPQATLDTASWSPATHVFMAESEAVKQKYIDLKKSAVVRLIQEQTNQKQRQSAVAMNISRFSPVSCFVYIMSTMARTGLMEDQLLKKEADQFAEVMEQNVYSKIVTLKFTGSTSNTYNFQENNVAPQFQQSRIKLSDVLGNTWLDIVLLFLYNILLFASTYTAFLKYDVR
jgi:ABC-type transport system involved in multi-copper enzyme maturation permease subunit